MSQSSSTPSSRAPLWAQVLRDLKERLASGEFVDRFPGDADIVDTYGVSRHTAREAVRHLQAEGLLVRRRGHGSFVTKKHIEQPIGALYSLFRSIEETGATQESIVRHLERRRDDKAEAMLGCPGEDLVFLERIRLADGEPIALDCSWLPWAVAAPLLEVDFHHTALYDELRKRCDHVPTSGWERIRPVLPDKTQRDLLGLEPSEPAFAIERLALCEGTPLEWRHGVVRGDRFSFVARWEERKMNTAFEQTTTIS